MPASRQDREAIFERYPIPRAVVSLSVPTVLSSLVALLYSLADTYFVGLLNDPVQTAAVTLAAPVLLAFNAVNNLFGVGGSSMMSRAYGRRDFDTLRRSSAFSFYGALIAGALFSLGCTVFRGGLLGLLGADEITRTATNGYLNWTVTLGAVPAILNVVIAYMIRSEGAAMHASIGTMSGCLLNILLDPLFILPWGLGMGSVGAAMATCLSNCFALGYFLVYLITHRKTTLVCISPKAFCLRRQIVLGVCGVGVPASIQNLLNVTGSTILNNLAAPYGAAALAAMGICARLSMVPMYVAMGISQGIMPLISYNYASRNIRRMRDALFFAARFSIGFLAVMALLLFLMPGVFVGAFIDDAQTVAYGVRFLRGLSLAVPLLGLDFLGVGVFQAVGMGRESLFFAILRKIILEIPLLYLWNALLPLYGLAYAQPSAELIMAAAVMVVLVRFLHRAEREARTSPGAQSLPDSPGGQQAPQSPPGGQPPKAAG